MFMEFIDSGGRVWQVQDYSGPPETRELVPLGSWNADERAFIDADEKVMLYTFGGMATHDTTDRTFTTQLAFAKAINGVAAARIVRYV